MPSKRKWSVPQKQTKSISEENRLISALTVIVIHSFGRWVQMQVCAKLYGGIRSLERHQWMNKLWSHISSLIVFPVIILYNTNIYFGYDEAWIFISLPRWIRLAYLQKVAEEQPPPWQISSPSGFLQCFFLWLSWDAAISSIIWNSSQLLGTASLFSCLWSFRAGVATGFYLKWQ